jgi:hypothetical protein
MALSAGRRSNLSGDGIAPSGGPRLTVETDDAVTYIMTYEIATLRSQ